MPDVDLKEPKLGSVLESIESSKREWNVVIIGEGRGSSGYYTRDVLERDTPTAFPVGTHVYVDHPTESERWERPERSLRDLAGIITETPHWDDEVNGVRARIKVSPEWSSYITEFKDYIGLSIRAGAVISEEANDDGTYDILSIVPSVSNSVDLVTHPGAKGRIVDAYESVRATISSNLKKKEAGVELKDIEKIVTEAIAPLIEAHKEPEATPAPEISETVKKIVESDLPAAVKVEIAESVDRNPDVDVDGLIKSMTRIAESVRAEAKESSSYSSVVQHTSEKREFSLDDLKF